MEEQTTFERFLARYRSGELPWNDALPPPEVIAIAAALPAGRALDLGCGYGRAAIYLAQRGWQADGVDYIPEAVVGAVARAQAAGVTSQTRFFEHSVAELDFLSEPYDLAIDVGCFHALTAVQRASYASGLRRLLKPAATYLLYVHLKQEADEETHGILETAVRQAFATGFTLQKVVHGTTQVEDKPPFQSAWYWYSRT